MTDETQKDRFPLSEVVEQLRKELAAAVSKSEDQDIRFKVNEIEIELKTVIEATSSLEGGFNFSVLKFGGGLSDKNAETQTIKLKLEPINTAAKPGEDNDVKISGRARRISSNTDDQ